ncbi:MAG: hypothetical protein IJ934_03805 [Acetobacter sp.]|nr:hypothetical protein [Acetobacter sp.]
MADDDDTVGEDSLLLAESKMPYAQWLDQAYRSVMCQALDYFSHHGRIGDHHFFITFRTDFHGVEMPPRVRAQYPHEITVVLRNQFWDLTVDRQSGVFSVTLSFSGVSSRLVVPFKAVTRFADPSIHLDLYFMTEEESEDVTHTETPNTTNSADKTDTCFSSSKPSDNISSGVISLDAFRKGRPPKPTQ